MTIIDSAHARFKTTPCPMCECVAISVIGINESKTGILFKCEQCDHEWVGYGSKKIGDDEFIQ